MLTRGYAAAATHLAKRPFRELPGDIITSIRRQNRGRANGLFMDSIDIFIRLVKKDDNKINKALRLLFRRIYNGQVHSSIIPYLTNTYFYLFCLYKDVTVTDPTQLRPIGVPTAIRRIITNHVANATRTGFARHLAPSNLAVGVNAGGMDFIVKASQLATERCITGPQCRGEAPTRSFVFLDLVNMFNEVSREVVFDIIRVKFPHVLPLVDLLYRDPGTVWNMEHTQTVEEGLNQGCPLSAVLAALVLQEVVQPILDKLNHRAATRRRRRNKYDDGAGGESHPMAYIDDLGFFIPHEDLLFFLTEFHRVGSGYGCFLNTRKTRIMTSTSGASAIPAIALQFGQAVADQVQEAINKFSRKEVVIDGAKVLDEVCDGLCLLGQPIGSLEYAIKFFDDRMAENAATATKLLEAVPDHQTALRLFSQCTLHKLPHLLGSE
ncbi:hypothetical protein ACHAXR_002233, partial [Thalassiosira sp. AJA248-18]